MNGAKTARYPEHHELAELFKFQDVTLKLCSFLSDKPISERAIRALRMLVSSAESKIDI